MKAIAAALLAVQRELDPVKKGKKGHNNKYADLPAVLDEAISTCNANGISVHQPIMPASMPNHARVDTILLHAESGETLTGSAEVPWRSESKMNDAQSYGSAVTYARRYSLVSILGIATEDDDGRTAYQRPARPAELVTGTAISEDDRSRVRGWLTDAENEPMLMAAWEDVKAAKLDSPDVREMFKARKQQLGL